MFAELILKKFTLKTLMDNTVLILTPAESGSLIVTENDENQLCFVESEIN